MKFFQSGGLTVSVRQYEQTLRNSTVYKSWFTEGLVQGSLVLWDLIRIGEKIQFTINDYFKIYNPTLNDDKSSPRKLTKNFEFFSTVNNAANFNEKLFDCLSPVGVKKKSISSFNLDRALANLAKGTLNNTVKSFKAGLNRTFVRSLSNNGTDDEQLYTLLCHSLAERANYYSDCIKELRRFATCVSSSRDKDEATAYRFLKPWLTAIKHFTKCKINTDEDGNANVQCKFHRTLPRTTTQRVKYIYEKILDQRIPKLSFLNHVANKLGSVLSKSKWGRQLTYDVFQYFAIYEQGHRRLNTLSKKVIKNKRDITRYKKTFASLNIYRDGILRETVFTFEKFHRSALKVQQFLIRGIKNSFKESWQSHLEALDCLSQWMTKLFELLGCADVTDTDDDTSTSTNISTAINMGDSENASSQLTESNRARHLIIYSKKNQLRKEADIIFERLMSSINYVSKVRTRNNASTLACLANNFLLVTMFMETISFISTLYCLGHKNESNIEEQAEEWNSSQRERRSLVIKNFVESKEKFMFK
ncbi:hypothetical protein PUN28_002011 [Cardiocondyla obscurior]